MSISSYCHSVVSFGKSRPMAIIPRLDVSPVGFLFNDTLEQTKSFDDIYGNIVESDPKGVREKERNDGVAFRKFLILEAKVCL